MLRSCSRAMSMQTIPLHTMLSRSCSTICAGWKRWFVGAIPEQALRSRRSWRETDPRNHYASPLYGDASGLPPTLIQVGSDEILRDDAIRMAEKLKAAGCDVEIEVWPRMPHAWHLYARILPEGRRALARIGAFLQQRL
jgi:acetyl esterase/lipase